MSAGPTIELFCPAKVNLALSVGAADTAQKGLHPIVSWMVAVDFADTLRVSSSNDGRSRFAIDFEPDSRRQVDWPLEKDLSCRAHALLEQHAGKSLPLHLILRKRIPPGAGLGGGSSDAAATLLAINRLYALGFSPPRLAELGVQLGSDVGFLVRALSGQPSALVSGIGQHIVPLPLRQVIHLVLIFPPFGCPTGAVYAAFDQLHRDASPRVDETRVRELAERSALLQDGPFNDLAEAACRVEPRLREIRELLHQELKLPVHITGSGSTLFLVERSASAAQSLARKVAALTGLPALAAHTL